MRLYCNLDYGTALITTHVRASQCKWKESLLGVTCKALRHVPLPTFLVSSCPSYPSFLYVNDYLPNLTFQTSLFLSSELQIQISNSLLGTSVQMLEEQLKFNENRARDIFCSSPAPFSILSITVNVTIVRCSGHLGHNSGLTSC